MKRVEIEVKISMARREMEFWEGILRKPVCGDCVNFQNRKCDLYGAAPPEGAKQKACDDWDWDEIPF